MKLVQGMIQVSGTTYRVARMRHGDYQVTRISDDVVVGSFDCAQTVQVTALRIDALLMKQLASAAVQQGRTSWMGTLVQPE